MAIRTAGCGHTYLGTRGRSRLLCDACAPLKAAGARVYLSDEAQRIAGIRWGTDGTTRKARCGHRVAWHSGGQVRACPTCLERPSVCCARPACPAEFLRRIKTQRYCSTRCADIDRGQLRAEPLPTRQCALAECGAFFTPTMSTQRCCCEAHGVIRCRRERRADGRESNPPWDDKRRAWKHEREARKRGTAVVGEPVTLSYIADRDRWMCHLCDSPVTGTLAWPDPMSPSLDHVVPLSLGGEHSRANVRLAHLRCNIRKSNRSLGEQLSLLG